MKTVQKYLSGNKGFNPQASREDMRGFDDEQKEEAIDAQVLMDSVIQFIRENPNPGSDQLEDFEMSSGYSLDLVMPIIFQLVTDHVQQHLTEPESGEPVVEENKEVEPEEKSL